MFKFIKKHLDKFRYRNTQFREGDRVWFILQGQPTWEYEVVKVNYFGIMPIRSKLICFFPFHNTKNRYNEESYRKHPEYKNHMRDGTYSHWLPNKDLGIILPPESKVKKMFLDDV